MERSHNLLADTMRIRLMSLLNLRQELNFRYFAYVGKYALVLGVMDSLITRTIFAHFDWIRKYSIQKYLTRDLCSDFRNCRTVIGWTVYSTRFSILKDSIRTWIKYTSWFVRFCLIATFQQDEDGIRIKHCRDDGASSDDRKMNELGLDKTYVYQWNRSRRTVILLK